MRDPAAILAILVSVAALVSGGLMMAGVIAPAVEPTMRFAFGGVLVLYGLYRFAAYSARRRTRPDDDE